MDFPKYNGNIHPDEWINDIEKYLRLRNKDYTSNDHLEIAISLVSSTIPLPTDIDSLEKLRNALREDIFFTIFKNTNKRKLQSLKYIPESRGGDTSKFISDFLKLCYNAEINDIEEQKKYLYKSLPMKHFDSISNEFYDKMKNVTSLNELVKEFEGFVVYESNLITNDSIVALKHVATGKYLNSIEDLHYRTGSGHQTVFVGSPEPGPNSLWKIKFDKELATYTNTSVRLEHIKSNDKFLGIYTGYKSPSSNYTEVSCNNISYVSIRAYWDENWKFNHSKLENYQGYLKSNDIIHLSIKKPTNDWSRYAHAQDGQIEFLRSHDARFVIGDDSFQEVLCHNERLGGNDEWCIELIKQYIWTIDD